MTIQELFSAMALSRSVTELPRVLHTYSNLTALLVSWPVEPLLVVYTKSLLSGLILAAVQGYRTRFEAKAPVKCLRSPQISFHARLCASRPLWKV